MGGKKVSWLELFYDLVFVAAFIQLGNGLSHHVTLGGFALFAGVIVLLWTIWTGFTMFANRFAVDDFIHRILVFAQMCAVGAIAVAAPTVFSDDPHRFSLSFAFALAGVALLYWRCYLQVPEARAYCSFIGSLFTGTAIAWGIAVFVPVPYVYGLWALGLGTMLALPFGHRLSDLSEQFPPDHEHLAERFGLLFIIVLGETFVKVIGGLPGDGSADILKAVAALTITNCLWWIYFDDASGSRFRDDKTRRLWIYAHIPLLIAVTAVGVAIKKAVLFDLDLPAPAAYRWLLCASLGLALLSVAVIDAVTERPQDARPSSRRIILRLVSVLVIIALALVGDTMNSGLFVGLLATVMILQVLLDMALYPDERTAEESDSLGTVSLGDSET